MVVIIENSCCVFFLGLTYSNRSSEPFAPGNFGQVNRVTLAAVVTSGQGRHLAKGGTVGAAAMSEGPGRDFEKQDLRLIIAGLELFIFLSIFWE